MTAALPSPQTPADALHREWVALIEFQRVILHLAAAPDCVCPTCILIGPPAPLEVTP